MQLSAISMQVPKLVTQQYGNNKTISFALLSVSNVVPKSRHFIAGSPLAI